MSRVGAPRLRPRRPFVCVGRVVCCVCWVCWADFVCGFWAGLGVLWCWLGAGFGVAGACVVIPCLRSYACWPCLGSVGGIATIGAALRRVVGVSGVYGRKTPRVVGRKGQRRVPVEGSMVVNLPRGCSKCSPPRWNAGDMGFLGCSGRRFGRAGSWRGVFCAAACWVRRASVRAAGMIEPTVGA